MGLSGASPALRAHESLTAGLDAARALEPGHGQAEIQGGWSSWGGPFVELDAKWRLAPAWSAYGYGRVDRQGQQVGVGLRAEW